MTPSEEKQLAKFAAEFCGLKLQYDFYFNKNKPASEVPYLGPFNKNRLEDEVFSNPSMAPILAHLAKREIEKLEFEVLQKTPSKAYPYFSCEIFSRPSIKLIAESSVQDENEYIAFWSAIMEATGGEK